MPVAAVVAVEVALTTLLVTAAAGRIAATVLGTVAALALAASVIVRSGGVPLGVLAARRAAYLTRHKQTLVAAEPFDDVPTVAGGPPSESAGVAHPPAELAAFFPGLVIGQATTHEGHPMGIAHWRGRVSATVRLAPPAAILRGRPEDRAAAVPLGAVLEAISAAGLAPSSVQLLTCTVLGGRDPGLAPLVTAAAEEAWRQRVRNRNCYLTVRVDPNAAADEIRARGGGSQGLARLLAAALSHVRAVAQGHGLHATVLNAGGLSCAIAESLYHLATPYDPLVRWQESAAHLSSSRMAHRSLAVSELHRPAPPDLPVGEAFATAVATELRLDRNGSWTSRSVLRLTCRTVEQLDAAGEQLSSAAQRAGIGLLALHGLQRAALEATVPLGGL